MTIRSQGGEIDREDCAAHEPLKPGESFRRGRVSSAVLFASMGLITVVPSAAVAEVCTIDLALDTEDEALEYRLFVGEAQDGGASGLAVCLAAWDPSLDDEGGDSADPVFVGHLEIGEGGRCISATRDSICVGRGCDSIDLVVDDLERTSVDLEPEGVVCQVDDASSESVVVLGDAPTDMTVLTSDLGGAEREEGIDSGFDCADLNDPTTQYDLWYGSHYNSGGHYYELWLCSETGLIGQYHENYINGSSDYCWITGNANANHIYPVEEDTVCYYSGGTPVYVSPWRSTWYGYLILEGRGNNDTLEGTPNGDVIFGDTYGASGSGYGDILYGHGGDDAIYGQDGNDTVYGGDGDDYISGYIGNDFLMGEEDSDTIYGGSGGDWLFGGAGDTDWLDGDAGNDYLYQGYSCNGDADYDYCSASNCDNRFNCEW